MTSERHQSLFSQLLGTAYRATSNPVQVLHDAPDGAMFHGTASVLRGRGISRLIGYFVSLPAARENAQLTVTIVKTGTEEIWRRDFAGDIMVSTLGNNHGYLSERLGPVRFDFELRVEDGAIGWTVRKVVALGIPLPGSWFCGVSAREFAVGDQYHFEVSATLPLIGRLIEYRGDLSVDEHA